MSAEQYWEWDIPASVGEGWWKVSEKAKEKFSENLRKAQAAQKKQVATEKKFKAFDNTLADIIQAFLNDWDKDQIVFYIADLVENNVPSDFILSILSLINDRADAQANSRVKDFWEKTMDIAIKFDDDISSQISSWIWIIYSCAVIDKEKLLESVIDSNNWECIPSSYLLFFEILVVFLEDNSKSFDRKYQKEFSKNFFDKMLEKLQWEI